jgi:hypothetical protein
MEEIRDVLNQAPPVPPTEQEAEIALIAQSVGQVFELIFGVTHTEDWKKYTLSEQKMFRDVVEQYYAAACIVREKFDADVWKGHSNGTVSPTIESIRKQREGEKPGKKAETPTAASILAKRLKK